MGGGMTQPPGALRSIRLAVRWELLDAARGIPILAAVQLVLAFGLAVGLGMLNPDLDRESTRYLATGAPTLAIVTLGMVVVPQTVAQRRVAGSFDYLQSMPIWPVAPMIASVVVLGLASIPGAFLALGAAAWHFDFTLRWSPLVLPVVALGALASTGVGYCIGALAPSPYVTTAATQVLMFGTMLFSPVNYPADRLPGWLAEAHEWLPVAPLASLIRGSAGLGSIHVRDMVVLSVWAMVATLACARAATRRT